MGWLIVPALIITVGALFSWALAAGICIGLVFSMGLAFLAIFS